MCKIIAVTNVKGGVGKTTTAVNLAAAFAERGHRVLAVDLDPQGSLTLSFGFQPDQQPSTVQHLLDAEPAFPSSFILPTAEKLDVIPANEQLRRFERELESQPTRIFAVRYALKPLRREYDYILLDCPANAGPLTGAALAASDKVVIPLTADYLAFQVARSLFRIIKEIQKRVNPTLQVAGIYLTMYDGRTRHARDILSELHRTYGSEVPLFSAVVHQSVRLKEAPANGSSILKYAPRSQAAQAYRVIAQEIDEGIRAAARPPAELDAALPIAATADVTYGVASFGFDVIPLPPQTLHAPETPATSAGEEAETRPPAPVTAPRLSPVTAPEATPAFAARRLETTVPEATPAFAARRPETSATESAPAFMARRLEMSAPTAPPVLSARRVEGNAPEMPPVRPPRRLEVNAPEAQAGFGTAGDAPPAATPALAVEADESPAVTTARDDFRRRGELVVSEASDRVQAGDLGAAHALFRQAIALNPLDVRAWIGCARTSDTLPERITFAKQALKLDPNNPDAHDVLMLTSTFMHLSAKEGWSWPASPLGAVTAGLLAVLVMIGLWFIIPLVIH